MNITQIVTFSSVAAFVLASSALAGRAPTAEEATAIERVVTDAGFTRWGTVELDDDGHWDVENAVAGDGKIYDLDVRDGKIIKQELETN